MSLLLALDSLLVCIALAPFVGRPVLLAGLFGLCDGLATWIGGTMPPTFWGVSLVGPLLLAGYAVAALLCLRDGRSAAPFRAAIWLVPLALAIDNLAAGAEVEALQAGLASCAMAGTGLLVGHRLRLSAGFGASGLFAASVALLLV